jgi:putative ABC transport system permease protein
MKLLLLKKLKSCLSERPLAWAQLSHQKVRLIVALLGVSFANILMFSQLGLRAVLFDGITRLHEHLNGELFLVSTYSRTLGDLPFAQVYLYQASGVPGVAAGFPLYIEGSYWINPEKLMEQKSLGSTAQTLKENTKDKNLYIEKIKILAFNPSQSALNLPAVNQQLYKLNEPDSILFDSLSQPSLGAIPSLMKSRGEVVTVMGNRRVHVVGLFELGSTLFTKGYVTMSDWNYKKISKNKDDSLKNVSVGLITLEPRANLIQVQSKLRDNLPNTIEVLTRKELIAKEMKFWEADPSGIVLTFGAVIGFIVGVIVVYQVLYTDVTEHIPEYATLKAMGYSDQALLLVVLQEALILAVLGFVPGTITSLGVYQLLSALTRIPLTLRPDVATQVFLLTIFMCSLSGTIAIRKLQTADPADIF